MDKYPEMKGHYLVMDNARIHTSAATENTILARGYKCIYLPELNPLNNCGLLLRAKLRGTSC